MATPESKAAAVQAFQAEDELWSLQEARDRNNRRVLQVRRGDKIQFQSFRYQEALDFLNEAGLTAAIMAAVAVISSARPQRNSITRRYR